ncbi:hypothetical protein [Mycolicibacterium brumae]|uniref:Uncharacterized protein n=1 Tax=Mycolicibacterium brumae TaxID=85968 RepID=A0A2G5PAK3_9MYCO|nr:hypothetical protein [Mycolicibacterium brumae]MCV7193963.1 hypothetical protein [Mycolicibacterium brumae]PIB74914.1 hypothetical protein CQY22_011145 [Mycolicibacterium brumae]RWA22460.1 hypothetical protein MBRU_12825 [Mycolicibacterium brumae DSM 44177]UWW08012.1 hypothetical protein L2Z93_001053 [Mycolicibacterium brumae]
MADDELELVSTPLGRLWLWLAVGAALILLVGLITVIATREPESDGNPSTPGAAAGTTTTTVSMPAFAEIDVVADDYQESPGYYRFSYMQTPLRECAIFPVRGSGDDAERGLACNVEFPSNTGPVTEGPFQGPPNQVLIVPPDGPKNSIGEGGPEAAPALPEHHRITVGSVTCLALPDDGVDCQTPTGGFRFEDGLLHKR